MVTVRSAVQEYAAREPVLRSTTDDAVRAVTTMLDDAGINYLTVTGRTKSVASFAAKAARTHNGQLVFDEPLRQITDQVGLRVIAYLQRDVAAVADLLADQFEVLDDRDMGQETASEGRFGYASRHLLLRWSPDQPVQVQVRTVLQHAWAEFEHDIRYKGTIPEEHVPDLDRRFTLAAGLLELADKEFSEIRDRLQVSMTAAQITADANDPRITGQELATFLSSTFADSGWSRTDHYSWIAGLLLELGISSLDELGGLLASVDETTINEHMGYKNSPGAVRRLDDALLSIFGQRYIDLHGNSHRRPLLEARLAKLS